MGAHEVKAITTLQERKAFLYHLLNDLKAMERMVEEDRFEKGVQRIGAEQELCLVDRYFRPANIALEVLEALNDPHFTTEIALFNIEVNLDPLRLQGKCFSTLAKDLAAYVSTADACAFAQNQSHVLMTGILPTLRKRDLIFENITPYERYKILNEVLRQHRGDDFLLKIKGVDELILNHKSILFEACNTSFQVHLQIPPEDLVDKYNWAQTIAGPVLSACSNSPLLLGRELWSETRIALFQQSVDLRNKSFLLREQKPRVSFGSDWIHHSVVEIFQDDIVRYTPLLTTDIKEDALEILEAGEIPKLKALQIHNGTIYRWNRLCYGASEGKPHLRIENRYLPSGPSTEDEIANAAFWVGLMQGMPDEFRTLPKRTAFNEVKGNFINAARTGINTYFNWFGKGISANRLILDHLLPMAENGLSQSAVDQSDAMHYLDIIKKRVEGRKTGSLWIKQSNDLLRQRMTRDIANANLSAHIYRNQQEKLPVHLWTLPGDENLLNLDYKVTKLEKYMTTEIFVVHENDLIDLVRKIMDWKKVHHVPVVNSDQKVIGIITSKDLEGADTHPCKVEVAGDLMTKAIVSVESNVSVEEAERLMMDKGIGCLPIIDFGELVGILTKNDLKKIQKQDEKIVQQKDTR